VCGGNEIMSRTLIKCNSIDYRKGYVEVRGDIHPNCINLEIWNIHPDIDISELDLGDDAMPDEAVIANTEIEFSIKKAEDLVRQLTLAIKYAREKSSS